MKINKTYLGFHCNLGVLSYETDFIFLIAKKTHLKKDSSENRSNRRNIPTCII